MKPAFEMSQDARLLLGQLAPMTVGEVVGYAALSKAIGRAVDGSFGPLRTAIRAVARDHGIELATIPKVGLKRLSDGEIVATSDQALDRIRRAAKRQFGRLTRVADFEALPEPLKAKHNATLALTAVVTRATSSESRTRVEAAAAVTRRELPMRDALLAMGLVAP